MNSPITGKEMTLRKEKRSLPFRKEEFEVVYHSFVCEDSGEEFEDEQLSELNLNQVYNQYRERHNLPFPDEITSIRNKYGISASKMSEVLGFGVNMYRAYESGEIPSDSNARLIQLASDPREFKKLVMLSNVFTEKERDKLAHKVEELIISEKQNKYTLLLEHYLVDDYLPNEFSGYKRPNLEKLTEMVVFFTHALQPWKTMLNKLLFYTDFMHFQQTCYSMSGTRYRAIDMGPVPNSFNSLFDYMHKKEHIDIHYEVFAHGAGEKFIPTREVNKGAFSELEWEILENVAVRFKNVTTKKIVDLSHEETGWKINFEGGKKLISYKYGFELKGS